MIVCTPKIDACCNWVFWGFFCGMVERMGRIDWTGWWAAPTAQTNAIVFFNFYFRFCFVWFYRQVPDFCLPYQDFVVVKESSTNNNLLKIIKPVQWGMLNIINSRNQRMHTCIHVFILPHSEFHHFIHLSSVNGNSTNAPRIYTSNQYQYFHLVD